MTGWSTRADLEHQIAHLFRRDNSRRQIARALGVTRGLVQRVVTGMEQAKGAAHTVLPEAQVATPRPSKLDAHQGRIKELLARYPSITVRRVFEELRAAGYDGGYSIVKDCLRRLRPPKPPEPSRPRPVFGPGEMAEQDWSQYRVEFADCPRLVHAYMLSLSYSRRRFVDFFESEDLFALLEEHRRAFECFPGVPQAIRYDNQKAVVARREGPDVIYQPRLLALATHYGFSPQAVRPNKPNDKAYASYCTSLCGFDADLRFRCHSEMPFHAYRAGASVPGGS
jgi:transposase